MQEIAKTFSKLSFNWYILFRISDSSSAIISLLWLVMPTGSSAQVDQSNFQCNYICIAEYYSQSSQSREPWEQQLR